MIECKHFLILLLNIGEEQKFQTIIQKSEPGFSRHKFTNPRFDTDVGAFGTIVFVQKNWKR